MMAVPADMPTVKIIARSTPPHIPAAQEPERPEKQRRDCYRRVMVINGPHAPYQWRLNLKELCRIRHDAYVRPVRKCSSSKRPKHERCGVRAWLKAWSPTYQKLMPLSRRDAMMSLADNQRFRSRNRSGEPP